MKELIIYALQTLTCSGVLLGVYMLLLERRVPMHRCRAYLLLSTAAAAIIPLLRIPVWAAPESTAPLVSVGEVSAEILPQAAPALIPAALCAAIYALGVMLILGAMLWQVVRMRTLRRGADIDHTPLFTLVRTPQRIAAFSFLRSIYVWDGTPVDELAAIVAHESSHIAHRHSVERIAMETMKAALWWNPFVWLAAQRLTEVEEFEADSDVLQSGFDRQNYMTTLFKQLFGYSPDIANGLRDSLTKKRFQMMTTPSTSRYNLLRLLGTLPAVFGLLCAFAFTTRAAEPQQTNQPLIVIDGVIQNQETFNRIDPDCIESIHVIKNESATDKYGPKAAFGVIEVMTKSGEIRLLSKEQIKNKEQILQVRGSSSKPAPDDIDQPFLVVETMPVFQSGDLNSFRTWIHHQLRYPVKAIEKKIEGRVIIQFIVERDGSVSNIEVLQTPDQLLSKEAVRVIESSPAWTPGKQQGKTVRVKYTIPIDFRLPSPQAK